LKNKLIGILFQKLMFSSFLFYVFIQLNYYFYFKKHKKIDIMKRLMKKEDIFRIKYY